MPFDYVIAGGGLQAGLLVLALRHREPTATIAVVERADTLGGNHTWSFHEADSTCRSSGSPACRSPERL